MIRSTLSDIADACGGHLVSAFDGARDRTIHGVGIDTRGDLTGRLFVAIRGERHDGHDHVAAAFESGAVAALVSADGLDRESVATSADRPTIVVEDSVVALAKLARHHRRALRGPVVGVTGSAGKTTTRAILESVLAGLGEGTASIKSFNNHIGVPLTLLEADVDDRWIVLEMGTSGKGEIGRLVEIASPDVSVVTGTGRAHLEGLGTEEDVAVEKASILAGATLGVVNVDRPPIRPLVEASRRAGRRIVTYGLGPPADLVLLERRGLPGGGQVLRIDGFEATFSLDGRHNAVNALAAIEVARELGVAPAAVADGLASVRPPAMRFARSVVEGITVLDDAYNANPESMKASIEAFSEMTGDAASTNPRRIAVLGAMLELGPASDELHREVGRVVAGSSITDLVVVSDQGAVGIADGAREAGFEGSIRLVDDAGEAATVLVDDLRTGDWVLVKASRGVGLEMVVDAIGRRRETSL